MQWLNGSYVGWFNRRHKRSGHLVGDRFHSFVIEKGEYLQRVLRYVVLNPVRAKMVKRPEDYEWSSYRATAGLEAAPDWLALGAIAPFFGEAGVWQANYAEYVAEAIGSKERLWNKVERALFLGTPGWVASMRATSRIETARRRSPACAA